MNFNVPSPLHLLLHIICKFSFRDFSLDLFSFRINLKIPYRQAAALVAVRNITEDLVIRTANNPQIVMERPPDDEDIIALIRLLSRSDAGNFMIQRSQTDRREDGGSNFRGGPPRGGQ